MKGFRASLVLAHASGYGTFLLNRAIAAVKLPIKHRSISDAQLTGGGSARRGDTSATTLSHGDVTCRTHACRLLRSSPRGCERAKTEPMVTRCSFIAANMNPDEDTINFDSILNGETITLTAGDLPVTKSVIIDASLLQGKVTIDADATASNNSRIFNITGASGSLITFDLKNVKLVNGNASGQGGAIRAENASLMLENLIVSNNYLRRRSMPCKSS